MQFWQYVVLICISQHRVLLQVTTVSNQVSVNAMQAPEADTVQGFEARELPAVQQGSKCPIEGYRLWAVRLLQSWPDFH